jgi:hypothetical protein
VYTYHHFLCFIDYSAWASDKFQVHHVKILCVVTIRSTVFAYQLAESNVHLHWYFDLLEWGLLLMVVFAWRKLWIWSERLWFRATLDKVPRSRDKWLQAILLVKGIKLVPRPLDKGPRPNSGKLTLNLHGTCFRGKSIGSDQKTVLKGELLIWRTKNHARDQGAVQLKDSICFKSVQIGT